MKLIDIWINCPDSETAQRIADQLLEQRLVACANLYPAIQSRYHWKGQIESDTEYPLLVKSRTRLFDAVCDVVTELHPYETPGIMGIPAERVNDDYRDWLLAETGAAG